MLNKRDEREAAKIKEEGNKKQVWISHKGIGRGGSERIEAKKKGVDRVKNEEEEKEGTWGDCKRRKEE